MSELFFYSSTTIVMAGILQLYRYQRVTQATKAQTTKHLTEEPYTTTWLNTSVASLITDLGVRNHLRSLTLQ